MMRFDGEIWLCDIQETIRGTMGGSSSSQSVSTTNSQPWESQQPYLKQGYSSALANLSTPKTYFPGSTVVPFSSQTQAALTGTENLATQGNPVNSAAIGNLQQTLSGQFLDPATNPAFQKAAQGIQAQLGGMFGGAGRYGSGAMANQGREALTDLAAKTYAGERANQMQALGMAPQISGLAYDDLSRLANVGALREQQAGAELSDQINRYNFGQNERDQAVARYMALVAGGSPGSTTTTSTPIYSNPWATGLGLASTGAGLAGSLFGKGGLFA